MHPVSIHEPPGVNDAALPSTVIQSPVGRTKPLLVVGHKNPDTDSICAAIAYAAFKSMSGEEATACRAGSINAQTRFALDRFDADDPVFLADVLPRVADIMIPRDELVLVGPDGPLLEAYDIIIRRRFSFMPVVDDDGRCVGRVTALGLAGLLRDLAQSNTKAADVLARPVSKFLEPVGPTFRATAAVRDIEHEVNRSNEGGFVVTDEDGRIAGVVTRMNFMSDARFRLALVDHNEFSQSVEGIEYALVEEIIDHHRIGMERTNEPITVINRVVGSTCSIVADMFRRSGRDPGHQTAGLMLSGILSDTVVLNSPTTSDFDRELAEWLAKTLELDMHEYGRAMFEAGSASAAMDPEDILAADRKIYEEKGHRFAVSQIEMVGFEGFWRRNRELARAVEKSKESARLSFAALMVTDITTSTTLLVLSAPPLLRERIQYPEPAEGVYEMQGVLSRKKQVLPLLLELI